MSKTELTWGRPFRMRKSALDCSTI